MTYRITPWRKGLGPLAGQAHIHDVFYHHVNVSLICANTGNSSCISKDHALLVSSPEVMIIQNLFAKAAIAINMSSTQVVFLSKSPHYSSHKRGVHIVETRIMLLSRSTFSCFAALKACSLIFTSRFRLVSENQLNMYQGGVSKPRA